MSDLGGMQANRRVRERPAALRPSFATITPGLGLVAVQCRCCGTPIGGHGPIGDGKVRRDGPKPVLEQPVGFRWFANYREVDIRMEDGGRHVGNACADCAERLWADADLLARFCETDLAQWRSEGATITARMDRRPVRVLRIAKQIKD